MFFGVLIGIICVGAMIYLALDKKSDFKTRLAALGAFAAMIIALIICLVIILTDNRVPVDPSILIVGAPEEVKDKNDNNLFALFFSIFFFIALFVIIVVLAMREHKRSDVKKM
ncbi:MAG: hypothetical protein FWB86_02960 [Treponema sp.]|nr:hypothetical protein [Treponema sp.]MCL2252234.1 hypothetical protein [Treponema sp.]